MTEIKEFKVKKDTIDYKGMCEDCGWTVIFACCNDKFVNFKDADRWDWWVYCSNKGCKNHDGVGIFQNLPKWIAK